jgi:hypothetical protein
LIDDAKVKMKNQRRTLRGIEKSVVHTGAVVRHGCAIERPQKPSNRKDSSNYLIKTQEFCRREKPFEVKQLKTVDQRFETLNLQKFMENHLKIRDEHEEHTEKTHC